jgi:hypothetical protein
VVRIEEYKGVMHHPAITGPEFQAAEVHVMVHIGRQDETLKLIRPIRGKGVFCGHREHFVGLTSEPAIGENRRLGLVARVSFWRAGIGPCANEGDLRVGKTPLVGEIPIAMLGFPWRHISLFRHGRNQLCAFSGVRIRQQRKRRDFSGPVTDRTILIEDWRNVFVESRRLHGWQYRSDEHQRNE